MLQNIDPATMIIFGVVGTVFLIMLVIMLQISSSRDQKRIKNRLDRKRARKEANITSAVQSLRLNQAGGTLDQIARRFLPKPAVLRERLDRTGYKISIGQLLMIGVGAGAFLAAGLWLLLAPPAILLLLVFVLTATFLPHLIVNLLIARRLKGFEAEFPLALDLIIRGLKSGLPVPESVRNVAEEFHGPVAAEFQIVTDKVKLGQSLEDALWDATKRIDLQDFKFFVICLAVQRETGGNLAETLSNLVDILRRRRQMKLKIKAMSGEAKASAIILGSLPFLMFGVLLMLNYDYTMTLFRDPRGTVAVGVGLGFMVVGCFVMKKMVSFEI